MPSPVGKVRKRRVDVDMKQEALGVVLCKRQRSTAAVARSGTLDIGRRSAGSHEGLRMVNYMRQVSESMGLSGSIALAFDGVKLGGEETIITAARDSSSGLSCWLPPQATPMCMSLGLDIPWAGFRDRHCRCPPLAPGPTNKVWLRCGQSVVKHTISPPGPLGRTQVRYTAPHDQWCYDVSEANGKSVRFAVKFIDSGKTRWELGPVDTPRPVLSLTHDRASNNLAAVNFMKHELHMRLVTQSDPFHDTWNDVRLALQGAKAWNIVLGTGHVFNVLCGPWGSSAFFRQAQSMCEEHTQTMAATDELYCHLYPDFARDMRLPGDSDSQEHKRAVLAVLADSDVFKKNPNKVALSRWLAWFERFDSFGRTGSTMLLALLLIGLHTGIWRSCQDRSRLGSSSESPT